MSDDLRLPPEPPDAKAKLAKSRTKWEVGKGDLETPLMEEPRIKPPQAHTSRRAAKVAKPSPTFIPRTYDNHGLRFGSPSLRAYRMLADNLLARAAVGDISWAEAKAGIAALQTAASMFLGEKVMAANGIEDRAANHALGPLGGVSQADAAIQPSRKQRVITVQGVDGRGNPVSSTTVQEERTVPVEAPVAVTAPDGLEEEFEA